ncbi:MAG: type III-B CRISPR module RAMP protein Cmr6 [Bacteroidota bacterium]
MSRTANTGWLYYKGYYHDFDFHFQGSDKKRDEYQESFFRRKNNEIFDQRIDQLPVRVAQSEGNFNVEAIQLITTYPGLATGTGMTHETGSKGESKLGFSFDHATGIPYLPGSSVKGNLRSAFPQEVVSQKKTLDTIGIQERRTFIHTLLGTILNKNEEELAELRKAYLEGCGIDKEIHAMVEPLADLLEREIFDGTFPAIKTEGEDEKGDIVHKLKSVYDRDIFFDAFPVESLAHDGRILGEDFITPHKHPTRKELDKFANPVPVQFLKILPKVIFEFRFQTQDGLLTSEQKLTLIETILIFQGVGAKTNVGYGQLEKPEEPVVYEEKQIIQGRVLSDWVNGKPGHILVEIEEAGWKGEVIVGKKKQKRYQDDEITDFTITGVDEKGKITRVRGMK